MASNAIKPPIGPTASSTSGPVSEFIKNHFRHFNASVLKEAALAYSRHVEHSGRMVVALAGAMSTAEIGVSLAEMIRKGKVHAISCTGANLEEDLFNLVARDRYKRIPNHRHLTCEEEADLYRNSMNRVTDTCIPDAVIWERLENPIKAAWRNAEIRGERMFPHEFLYQILRSDQLTPMFQIDPRDSWLVAASEKNIPIVTPGWEDSALGNMFAGALMAGELRSATTIKSGIEAMMSFADWYDKGSNSAPTGLLQIGGGIAGDFPICVVPMLHEDLYRTHIPRWSYFCQVSDSTMSYGSYSGAFPNEKISWGKLDVHTPSFVIESDATIVVPLMFAVILGL